MTGKLVLEDNNQCYVCGKENARGFQLLFSHPKKGRLLAEVVFGPEHQGFKNIVHGGMVTMLLDEMMINLAWIEGAPCVTAELTVRLKKAIRVGERVFLEGHIDRQQPRAIYASSWAKNAQGELLAAAKATCLRVKRQ